MPFAASNNAVLRYIEEVTFGTTPATPALSTIRYTGESLNYNISNVTSQEIRNDRMVADLVQTSADASGDVNVEWSYGTFDDFLEAALCGTWTTNVLENGTDLRSYTIQKEFGDLTAPEFVNFTGCRIGGVSLNFQTGSILTGSFNFMGLGAAVTETQFTGATFPAASTTDVMNSVSNVTNIKVDTVAFTGSFQSMTLNINNNLRPQDAIGTLGHVGIPLGTCEVTGDLEIYFEDSSMLDRYVSGTEFSLEFTTDDGTSDYAFFLPRVKFETGEVVSGGLDQDVILSTSFRAIRDSSTGIQVRVTRTP